MWPRISAVHALRAQIESDTKTLGEHQANGTHVGTDKDLVVFVEKMDTLARSCGLEWTGLTYQGFASLMSAGTQGIPSTPSASTGAQ